MFANIYIAHCSPSACVQIWYWSLTGNGENKANGWSEQKNANNRSNSQCHEGGSREMHRRGSCLRVYLCVCMCFCVSASVFMYLWMCCDPSLHLHRHLPLSAMSLSFISSLPPSLATSLSFCLSVSTPPYPLPPFSLSLSPSVCRIGNDVKMEAFCNINRSEVFLRPFGRRMSITNLTFSFLRLLFLSHSGHGWLHQQARGSAAAAGSSWQMEGERDREHNHQQGKTGNVKIGLRLSCQASSRK